MTGPGIYSYSTTPANNVQANTGINWDEGMSPAAVNNSARQNMTDMRNAFNDLIWFKYGKGDLDYSPVYASGTTFTVAGVDVTAVYHVGRRVKAVGSSTGTIYGTISASSFSTNTTVTVVWDSGSLSNETLTIYLSQIPLTGSPIMSPPRFRVYRGTSNQTGISSGVATTVIFNTATTDPNTMVNLTTGVATVNKTGVWHFDAAVIFSATLTGSDFASLAIYKNGSIYSTNEFRTGTTAGLVSLSCDVELTASDTVQLKIQIATSSGTVTVGSASADTWWNGRWCGP